MNTDPISFQSVLDDLANEKKEFPRKHLPQFSDLQALELQTLLDVWARIGLKRKLNLLEELETLAESDTLVSFEDFAKALLADTDSTVRGRALRLLKEAEDPTLVPKYIDILTSDPEAQTRAEAAAALGLFVDLGELEEISVELRDQVERALLLAANGTDDPKVRRRAVESLGYSSNPDVMTLIESAFQREDPAWQTSALFAMGRSADNHWDEDILHALSSENKNVREAAVEAAGQLSIKDAGPLLLNLLEEEDDDEVSGAIIWSLSQIGGEDARTYIENLLAQTEDDEQIEFLEEALENLSFTEDLDRFDLLNVDPEFDLQDPEVDDVDPDEDEEEK